MHSTASAYSGDLGAGIGQPSGSNPGGMMSEAPSHNVWKLGSVWAGGRGGMEITSGSRSGSSGPVDWMVTFRKASDLSVRKDRKFMDSAWDASARICVRPMRGWDS